MTYYVEKLREICANVVALCRAIKTLEPDEIEELKEGAAHIEQECLDTLREIDSAEDN